MTAMEIGYISRDCSLVPNRIVWTFSVDGMAVTLAFNPHNRDFWLPVIQAKLSAAYGIQSVKRGLISQLPPEEMAFAMASSITD